MECIQAANDAYWVGLFVGFGISALLGLALLWMTR